MRIVIISDTHEHENDVILPNGDMLIHAGDITNRGTLTSLYKFCNWMKKQSFLYKIVIAGNHDHCFQNHNKNLAIEAMKESGIIYLQDSGIEIDGIKIFGQPWQPFFYNWSFNLQRGAEIAEKWKLIPNDTNILITHGPPHGILDLVAEDFSDRDRHQGCEELKKKVDRLPNLKLHVFGHLHHQGGNQVNLNNKNFINAAICNDRHDPINLPQIFDYII